MFDANARSPDNVVSFSSIITSKLESKSSIFKVWKNSTLLALLSAISFTTIIFSASGSVNISLTISKSNLGGSLPASLALI